MFDEYVKSLANALADNTLLKTVRNELEDLVMFEKNFNEFAGQEDYYGVCLSSPIEVQTDTLTFGTDLYNPITIRVKGYHDMSIPNPCAEKAKDPYKLIDTHPIAFSERPISVGERLPTFGEIVICRFTDGPNNFGRGRGIRYSYPLSNAHADYECRNLILKAKTKNNLLYIKNIGALGDLTPSEIANFARLYDTDTFPLDSTSKNLIKKLHISFQPYVKAFVWLCWNRLGIKIYMKSGFRDLAHQTRLWNIYKKWEADGGTREFEPGKGYKYDPPLPSPLAAKPGKPSATSHHTTGTAFDCALGLPNGKTLGGKWPVTIKMWEDTGVPTIGRALGMDYGGRYGDLVHFDIGAILPPTARRQLRKEAKNTGIHVTKIPFPTPVTP